MRLNISVDEIILDGVTLNASQVFEFQLALERELSAAKFSDASVRAVQACKIEQAAIHVTQNCTPRSLASSIAASILGTVNSSPSTPPAGRQEQA